MSYAFTTWLMSMDCSNTGLVYDDRTGRCSIPYGRMSPVKVPVQAMPYVRWQALVCTIQGGYPVTTGLPDEFRSGDRVGCCRTKPDLFCDANDWMWRQ